MQTSNSNIARISFIPTHGTAQICYRDSIFPANKAELEKFWCMESFGRLLPESEHKGLQFATNPNDSHGKPDVLMRNHNGVVIGIQVTELTYESERMKTSLSNSVIRKILNQIKASLSSNTQKIIVSIFLTLDQHEKLRIAAYTSSLIDSIKLFLVEENDSCIKQFAFGRVVFTKTNDNILIPNECNVGVTLDYSNLSYSFETYADIINKLVSKKAQTSADWLLIWSASFWKDAHWLENDIVKYLRRKFINTEIKNVLFVHAPNGSGSFQNNFKFHLIKSQTELNSCESDSILSQIQVERAALSIFDRNTD